VRSTNSTLAVFAENSASFDFRKGTSALRLTTALTDAVAGHIAAFHRFGRSHDVLAHLGQGTHLHEALRAQFDPARHDRAIVFTDEQSMDDESLSRHVPQVVYFNLAGYGPHTSWGKGRIHLGGYSDAALLAVADILD
jgi:hypothetical protein